MKCKSDNKKQEIKLMPECDSDIFNLGVVFGGSKLPYTMVYTNSKLESVTIKTKSLWVCLCRSYFKEP